MSVAEELPQGEAYSSASSQGVLILGDGAAAGFFSRLAGHAVAHGRPCLVITPPGAISGTDVARPSPEGNHRPAPGRVVSLTIDLYSPGGPAAAVKAAREFCPGLTALFLAFWPAGDAAVADTSLDAWQEQVVRPLTAMAMAVNAAAKVSTDSAPLSIVFLVAAHASASIPQAAASSALAAGTEGLMRAAALDLARRSIRVNGVQAGLGDDWLSTSTREGSPAPGDWSAAPLERPVTGADLASAMWFLASDAACAITGTILRVDAGLLAQRYRPR